MANGYLGKISAVVSANTADFDGKLSKSAKEVSSFARSVQSNLTSASRQAARSLEGIYTPLQKFERSLQAAASMKLSFKGFPGMIKDLDSLQSRLNSALSQRQVDIVLKTTGMSSVSALRDAISGLKSKDIELIARVGGIDKLKELGGKITADVDIGASRERLAKLTAAAEAAKAKVASIGNVPVTVKVNADGVDSLRAKLEEARGAAGKLMGGEFMGQKSLTKAISWVSAELITVEAALARAAAAKKTLETMSSGPRSKPEELNRANERVSSLTGQKQELDQKLAELEKYRDSIKTVMREIKQAEAGSGAAAGGGNIAAAKKEEAAAIRAVSRAAKELQTQITAKYGVDIDLSDLEQLISRGGKASDVLERLPALMDELGRSDLEAASNKMRQLVSVSEELSDPIKAAQATLTGLAKEVQAGFLPALVQSQSELESLNALIEDGIAPTAAIKKNFDQVKASVDATVASVRQLAEVSEKAGRLKTGRELVFAQPAMSESLDRGAAVGNKAAGLPASAISSSPRLVESLVAVNQLTREAEAAFAKLQMKANVGLPTGSSQRSLDLLVAKLNEAIITTENLANAQDEAKSRAAAAAESEIANFIRVQQAAKAAEAERLTQSQKVADSEIANSIRVQQAAKAAEAERLAQAQKVADSQIANFIRVQQAAKAAELERQAQSQRAADSEIAMLIRREQAARDAARGGPRGAQSREFQQSFGGSGAAGLNLGLDQRALQGYNAELQILQGAIGRASAEARGPAVAAFERLRNAVATAFDEGNIDSRAMRMQLAAIRTEAIAAAAAAGGVRVGSLTRDVARAGDVGRGGFDKFSLGLNQAAFAIDDFMSSTGGLEFKLRAISNNITQLGFVVGGTAGLFVGLGAVIAGQAAVGIIKWINNGRTAEDQTKALNEALARQKSLVEELAEAFRSLGDSMSRGTLSAAGEQAADFSRQIEEIKKKQAEVRKNRVADLDPKVQQERAEQNKLNSQLEKETDPGRRIAITREMADSQRRERDASSAATARLPAEDEARVKVRESMIRIGLSELGPNRGDDPTRGAREQQVRDRAEAKTDAIPVGGRPEDVRAQMTAVNQQIEDAKAAASKPSPLGFATSEVAAKEILKLEQLLRSLEQPLAKAIDDAAVQIADSSRGPAEQIRQAQEEVAKAIEAGLPGARIFGEELDEVGGKLSEAYKKLREVVSGKDASGKELTVDEKETRTKQAQAEIDALQAQRARIAAQSDAFRYERTVDPQRQIDARTGRARSNLGDAGLDDGRIARRMREIENERATIQRQAAMPENDNAVMREFFEGREAALNEETASIEAATIAIKIFADALNRASEEAKGNLNSAQQRADETRRADLGNSTPQTQEARKQAEADLERQKETERAAQTEIAVERDRLEQMQQPDAERMQQIDEELKSGREFDPGLVKQRGTVEADAAAAEESRQKFQNVVDSRKTFSDAVRESGRAERDMGIDSLPIEERDKQLEEAGRGDLVKNFNKSYLEMKKAEEAVGLEEAEFADALNVAKTELAAAIERQAQAANALAEIDEKIAAGGMSGDRETLIREREALQGKMEDDARASQAKVDAARDASTREAEQAKSGERGRDMTRTPEQKFKAESEQGLADIQTYFERRAEANNGLRPAGDAEAQAAAEERFRKDREKEARTATSEGRGAELGMTERDRFRRDFKEGAGKDINARAAEMRAAGEDPTKFLQQSVRNQMEQIAPMLASFRDERANADFQGPSRKALQMSDVTTGQGQTELNRLLRGDDASKDVNLVELQKQTDKLQILIDTVKGNPLLVVN
jgi:chromosome segregation ATPase